MNTRIRGGATRSMERFSAAVVGDASGEDGSCGMTGQRLRWRWRSMRLGLRCWFGMTLLPWWVLGLAGGYVVQWQFSLQHEAIHGWRTMPARWRTAIVWLPLGLWFPFELYRRSHSQHHRNVLLTFPDEDTETYYHPAERWDRYGRVWMGVLIVNQTLLGRLLLGPVIRPPRTWWREGKRIAAGRLGECGDLGAAFLGVAAVLGFAAWCGVSPGHVPAAVCLAGDDVWDVADVYRTSVGRAAGATDGGDREQLVFWAAVPLE